MISHENVFVRIYSNDDYLLLSNILLHEWSVLKHKYQPQKALFVQDQREIIWMLQSIQKW